MALLCHNLSQVLSQPYELGAIIAILQLRFTKAREPVEPNRAQYEGDLHPHSRSSRHQTAFIGKSDSFLLLSEYNCGIKM